MNKPNEKYDHIFVIVRHDLYQSDPFHMVTLTRAFWNENDAKNEVDRLNEEKLRTCQKRGGPCEVEYRYHMARLERKENLSISVGNKKWAIDTNVPLDTSSRQE